MVLSSLDVVHILDFSSHPWWDSSWPLDLPFWKNSSFALLAVCGNYSIFTSSMFIYYVLNRH